MLALEQAPTPVLTALRARLNPLFVNEQQRAFLRSQAPELLYSGAYRAGKSRIGCEKALLLAQRYPGIPVGIFRKVARSLRASTELTLVHDVLRPHNAIARVNLTDHWYELANGSRIWLFGLDKDPATGVPSKVGSIELGWAFIDEAAECEEGDWVMVKGRLSWPGIPYHQIAAATNPANPQHWLKQRFTPPTETRQYLHASTFDNPALPLDYLAEAAAQPDGYWKSLSYLGEWTAAEGAIWHMPADQVTSPTVTAFKRVRAGIDWGFVHAFACEIAGQSGSGRLAVIDEVYERGRGVDQLAPVLAERFERHGVEVCVCDPSEPGLMAELSRHLARHRADHGPECRLKARVEGANNDVDLGIQAVDRQIREGMTIAPHCQGVLGELPGYTWAPNKTGGFHERPIDINDDACDALRYLVMAFEPDPSNPWSALAGRTGTVSV